MVVPSSQFGNLLVTDGTDAILFFPKANELASTMEGSYHLQTETVFEVGFPGWVEWVGISFDFVVRLNG